MPFLTKKQMRKLKILTKINKRDVAWVACVLSCAYFYTVGIPTTASYLVKKSGIKQIQKVTVLQAEEVEVTINEDPMAWMQKQWIDAGANWNEVWAVTKIESQWDQEAWNCNGKGSSLDEETYALDVGLYQLNSIHEIKLSCSIDLRCATNEAIRIWKEQGWTPWYGAAKLGIK